MTHVSGMAYFILFLLRHLFPTSGYEDLSFNKYTQQSSTHVYRCRERRCSAPPYPYLSSYAVDRDPHTCAITSRSAQAGNLKNWWYVDLSCIYNVYEVRIMFGKDAFFGLFLESRNRGALAGFSLLLSNSSNIEDGVLCYKDGPALPPLNINVNCSGHARYVFYYNERLSGVTYPREYSYYPAAELCEVFVLGCPEGVYGFNCDLPCPENCTGSICDIVNGTCYGCEPGWKEEFCDQECPSGSYGMDCKYQCAGHCMNGLPCNHVTGECPDKCAAGWVGKFCDKQCLPGFYGINCQHRCSGQCVNDEICSRYDGSCSLGCKENYVGVACDILQDSPTSALTVGIAIVVAALLLCQIAAFIFFCLRPQHRITKKELKPKCATEDNMKRIQSSYLRTSYANVDAHIYQDVQGVSENMQPF